MELKIETGPYGQCVYLDNPSLFIQAVVDSIFSLEDITGNHLVCQSDAMLTSCDGESLFIEFFGKDPQANQNLISHINERLTKGYNVRSFAGDRLKSDVTVSLEEALEIVESYSNTPAGTNLQLEVVAEYTGSYRPFLVKLLGQFVVDNQKRKEIRSDLLTGAEKGLGLLSEKRDWLVLKWGKNMVIISQAI